MSSWQRTSGQIDAGPQAAQEVEEFLHGAQVIARIESDSDDPSSAWLNIAIDEDNRVAVLADDGESIIAGPTTKELAQALATECRAVALIDNELATPQPSEGVGEDRDPFDLPIGIALLPARALVRIGGGHENVEKLATASEQALTVLPAEGSYIVLVEDGPAVDDLALERLEEPSIVLRQGEDHPAISVVEGEDEHLHVWGLSADVVPRGIDSVERFVDDQLGLGFMARQVIAAGGRPNARSVIEAAECAADAVSLLLRGPVGLTRASEGGEDAGGADEDATERRAGQDAAVEVGGDDPLDLLAEFLRGHVGIDELDGLEQVVPVTWSESVRRRAQGAADDARHAATTAAEDTRKRAQDAADEARKLAEDARRAAEEAWRRADEARVGATAWAEEPTRKWGPYVLAGAAAITTALVWRRIARRR